MKKIKIKKIGKKAKKAKIVKYLKQGKQEKSRRKECINKIGENNMFEKWFKENNENIYILKEDLEILRSNKDLNILNLYLNLEEQNLNLEQLLKEMMNLKQSIISECDKDRNFELKIINEKKKESFEILEDVLKDNWENILRYISVGEPLFYQMVKNSIPFNLEKVNDKSTSEAGNKYNIIIAFANNPALYLKNKNFEVVVKNIL